MDARDRSPESCESPPTRELTIAVWRRLLPPTLLTVILCVMFFTDLDESPYVRLAFWAAVLIWFCTTRLH